MWWCLSDVTVEAPIHNCCSGTCSGDPLACEGDGDECGATREMCTSDRECCSTTCTDGRCAALSLCRPAGEPCVTPEQCCGLLCTDGYCQTPLYCLPTFEPCDNDNECCSFRCSSCTVGPPRCLPIGGCRTSGYHQTTMGGDVPNEWGELCTRDEECCSRRCTLDPENIFRCQKRMGHPGQDEPEPRCLPSGELCENDSHCCSGSCLQLRDDPPTGPQFPKRCTNLDCDPRADPDCCIEDGELCSDPAECCGDICLLHPDGEFRCGIPPTPGDAGVGLDGGVCVPRGGDCTTDSDCCESYTCIPIGARLVCEVALL